VVEARLVIAKSVRVGKFAVENVECTVLPAELTNAPPLLGMTFLGNYNCRLNTEAGTMTLTKVSVPGTPTAKRKPAK
jgi:predicted aspartyl protease